MPELHSLVCVKVTPKPEEIRVDPQTMLLDREKARSEINPPDMNALEMALALKDRHGGRVSVLSMGPPLFEPYLKVALAMGADWVYLLSDRKFAGADTLATTYTLAQAIKRIGRYDLIFCGEESSDGATGQVPPGLAEWLNIGQLTLISRLELSDGSQFARGRREVKGGYEILEVLLPAVVSVKTASNEPRFMDYDRKNWAFTGKNMTIWSSTDFDLDPQQIGLPGSPTVVTGLADAPIRGRRKEFLTGQPDEIARKLADLIVDAL
jgi:electron transfer flavoprotein beta subunit